MSLKSSLTTIITKLEAVPLSSALRTISEVKIELEAIVATIPEEVPPMQETLPLFPDEETPQ